MSVNLVYWGRKTYHPLVVAKMWWPPEMCWKLLIDDD